MGSTFLFFVIKSITLLYKPHQSSSLSHFSSIASHKGINGYGVENQTTTPLIDLHLEAV